MSDSPQLRAVAFERDYPAWVALSHFLSADLMRELAGAMVRAASDGRLRIEDLCDEILPDGPTALAIWAVQPKADLRGLSAILEDALRALAWQTDVGRNRSADQLELAEQAAAHALEAAFDLASADLQSAALAEQAAVDKAGSLAILARAIAAAAAGDRQPSQLVGTAEDTLAVFDAMIGTVALKHIGDLCIDADRAHDAMAFYDRTLARLANEGGAEWSDLKAALRDMTIQSRAVTLWTIDGPATAAEQLDLALETDPLSSSLLRLNAGVDTMNARFRGPDIYAGDIRVALLNPPQLLSTHDIATPLAYWQNRKDGEAQRRFWAVLRRRIALGSHTETGEARAMFGRALLDYLGRTTQSQRQPKNFLLALQLILTSGQEVAVGDEASRHELLAAYVTHGAVETAFEIAMRHAGVRTDRLLVLIKLYRSWLTALPSDEHGLARQLIDRLAGLAESDTAVPALRGRDIGIASVKALSEVVRTRPEFGGAASDRIADAIVAQLGIAHFQAKSAALELAVAGKDSLADSDLARLALAALNLIEASDPAEGSWLRPAITFIASDEIQALWALDPAFGTRAAAQLLRHGLGSDWESRRLIALLDDITPYLPEPPDDVRIGEAIAAVRSDALHISQSGNASDIAVLLAYPAITGREGVDDALAGLVANLDTARVERPSIMLAHAYEPLLALTHSLDAISAAFQLSPSEEAALARPVIDALAAFWVAAEDNPQLFAPFAIASPMEPNMIIVQNWAFATAGFARRVGAEALLDEAMGCAARNPVLSQAITLGQALRLTAEDPELLDREAIIAHSREPFYAAIGQRMAQIMTLPDAARAETILALSEQCLVHGPNALDAGVFLLAAQAQLVPDVPAALVKAYRVRLDRDRNLRRSLLPLLHASRIADIQA